MSVACACVHKCVWCIHVHTSVVHLCRGQGSTSGCLPQSLSTLFLSLPFWLDWLGDNRSAYLHPPPLNTGATDTEPWQASSLSAEDQTQGLVLAQWTLCPLSRLPSAGPDLPFLYRCFYFSSFMTLCRVSSFSLQIWKHYIYFTTACKSGSRGSNTPWPLWTPHSHMHTYTYTDTQTCTHRYK